MIHSPLRKSQKVCAWVLVESCTAGANSEVSLTAGCCLNMSNLCLGMFMAALWSLQPRRHMGQVTLLPYQISALESGSFQRKLCLKKKRRRRILFTSITIDKWCHPIVLFSRMPFVVTESQTVKQICSKSWVQTAPNQVVTERYDTFIFIVYW